MGAAEFHRSARLKELFFDVFADHAVTHSGRRIDYRRFLAYAVRGPATAEPDLGACCTLAALVSGQLGARAMIAFQARRVSRLMPKRWPPLLNYILCLLKASSIWTRSKRMTLSMRPMHAWPSWRPRGLELSPC